jgi:hypothetical protein
MNRGPTFKLGPELTGTLLIRSELDTYENLFGMLQEKGYPILGATFVIDPKELQGFRRPEFRVMTTERAWLVWDVIQKWRQIVFAAGDCAKMPLVSSASRIASGLRYAQMRLDDLVMAYSVQLRARLHDHVAKEYQAFKDMNCFEVYKAIHALFWEMAVLRDALAEFASGFCFSRADVRTMRGLRKALSTNPARDALADEILCATDPSGHGWLAMFSTYRNCFTHVAPMEQAAGIAFAVHDMRMLSSDQSIPQIYYALPRYAEELERRRSRGISFSSL